MSDNDEPKLSPEIQKFVEEIASRVDETDPKASFNPKADFGIEGALALASLLSGPIPTMHSRGPSVSSRGAIAGVMLYAYSAVEALKQLLEIHKAAGLPTDNFPPHLKEFVETDLPELESLITDFKEMAFTGPECATCALEKKTRCPVVLLKSMLGF